MHEKVDVSSQTRNSALREMTARPRRAIAEFIHEHTPLEATHLSMIGTVGVLAGASIAMMRQEDIQKDPKKALLPLVLASSASLLDAIDGPLSRIEAEENPNQVDTAKGMLVDVLSDRTQELGTALIRGVAAHRRDDSLGEILAFTAAATNSLPSVIRANAESKGYHVPETGNDIVGVMGTRVGRAGMNIVASVFPKTQPWLDGAATISNGITTIRRMQNITKNVNTSPALSSQIQEEGKIRARVLTAVAGFAAVATVFTYKGLQES